MCNKEDKKEGKWYKVVKARKAIYTDPDTGKIVSANVVKFNSAETCIYEFPQCGIDKYLLEEGDVIQFDGNSPDGQIVRTK
jgi:hypothetical protein